ncbi:MAG TPA: tRNA (adenosine(37)-N6)-threonylcarbamoyltransferase complex dimerization subunit type 1 TsaB [Vicinamibacterales bacterium]|nr:tRNA (adenosine(37)-N6)-threonylcarbamoyltransferase complex dimerization subunit type 1 TsaB [Vicinamibacterales bacterium]
MLTLALDTTTKAGSVAVMRGDRLLAVVHGDATRTHGERLPEELARAMAAAGIVPGELTLLAVATGPGAFTGLRIGLAAMQGLAMVIGCPVVGVSALDALAAAALGEADPDVLAVAPWMDAQRGEVFAAFYARDGHQDEGPHANADPVVGAPGLVLKTVPAHLVGRTQFVGDGAERYRSEIRNFTAAARVRAAPSALAPFIARLGQQLAARGKAGPPHALQPLYVRRPDAELERQRQASADALSPSRDKE